MTDYTSCTVSQLLAIIRRGDDGAYTELFARIKPIILNAAQMYKGKMVTFGLEDLIQEGDILAWQVIEQRKYENGKFLSYFKMAVRYRYCEIFRAYSRKNPAVLDELPDFAGNGVNVVYLGEADYIKSRCAKEREYSKKRYYRKKEEECREKGIPFTGPKPKRTPEEQYEFRKAQAREYYRQHKEECNRKRTERRRELRALQLAQG